MKKLKPRYIRENDGSITEIKTVMGVNDERKDSCYKWGIQVVANLNPELVITREEYDKQSHEFYRKRFEKNYGPTIKALKAHRSLTAQQLSEIIKAPKERAETVLERFYKAGLIGKVDNIYTMNAENEKDISNSFDFKFSN